MTLKVIKASAGSGKTFRLAAEYLKLLLQMDREKFNDGYFSQILAITFTNAATAEMKERILKELYILGYNTAQSPHLDNLLHGGSPEKLAQNARRALEQILIRYDRFSISTIDKFFQTIVRSIIHEANIPGNFEIELDTKRLNEKAIDSRLANLSPKDPLYFWINLLREEKLREGGNFTFRSELSKLADTLQYKKWNSNRTEEDLNKLKKFYEIINFELRRLEKEGDDLMSSVIESKPDIKFSNNIDQTITNSKFEDHFKNIRNSKTLSKILRSDEAPSDASLGFLTQANQNNISTDNHNILIDFYNKARSLYEWIFETERYANTLRTLKSTFISFSVLSYLEEAVNQYCLENQILTLQQSNQIISDKIQGFDAPFIFEKLGQRFRNIFIDEFQDTAKIQFENLTPLLEETLSTNNTNLIVGDIKQSIYRWREGDWRLLHQTVAERFAQSVQEENLQFNFRSSVDIVSFNNAFYENATAHIIASITSELVNSIPSDRSNFPDIDAIAQVYSSASQIHRKEHSGMISVQFCPPLGAKPSPELKEEYEILPLELMIRQIDECLSAGYRKKDILILYRNNKSGKEIAEFLLRKSNELNKDYRFTSQESLAVGKSLSVSLIISLLNYISDRDQYISMAEMVHFSHLLGINKDLNLATVVGNTPMEANEYMIKNLFRDFPGLEQLLKSGQNMTLLEMVNAAISIFRLNEPTESIEYAYLLKLQDQVLEFTEKNDQNLGNFLDYWADKGKNASLDLPKNIDAIRLLSIHRSKGLQAPVVLLPFANLEFKGTYKTIIWSEWNKEEVTDFPIADFTELGPFPVNLNSTTETSLFSRAFINEQILQYLDTLNLYYVATTRAEDRLYMICEAESEKKEDKTWSLTTGQLLKQFFSEANENISSENVICGEFEIEQRVFGRPEDSKPIRKKDSGEENQYKLHKMHVHNSDLGIKSEWLPEKLSSTLVQENESIERGLLTHELLEDVAYASDLDRVINKAMLDGRISKSEELQWRNHLFSILHHPDISPFFAEGLEVINEQGIIAPGAKVQRPDRIVISGQTTTIIDYKTGQKREKYQQQIQAYAELLFDMGFPGIQGYILYTDVPELIKVPLNYQSKFFTI